jgi:competence protein ComEA
VEQSRGQVLVWVVAAVLATLAMVRVVGGGEDGSRGPAPSVRMDREAGAAAAGDGAAGAYVHVAGRVHRPGLYRLPGSARVARAVEKAGGPAPGADLSAVNLAARVEDGQQIVVRRVGASPAAAGGAAAAAGGASSVAAGAGQAKLSLAQASQQQLEELDGIGPTLAKRILEYRDANGGFRSLGELKEVEGIGEKRFQSLSEAVTP